MFLKNVYYLINKISYVKKFPLCISFKILLVKYNKYFNLFNFV